MAFLVLKGSWFLLVLHTLVLLHFFVRVEALEILEDVGERNARREYILNTEKPNIFPLGKLNKTYKETGVYSVENQPDVYKEDQPDVKKTYTGRHIPVLIQISHDTFELLVPHVQELNHYINDIFVVVGEDVNGPIVFYGILSYKNDTRPVAHFKIDLDDTEYTTLTPFANCNEHGLWKGSPTYVQSPSIFNATVKKIQEDIYDQGLCSDLNSEGAVYKFRFQDGRNVDMALLNTDGERIKQKSNLHETTYMEINMTLPSSSWLGVGFGDSMLNTPMIVCLQSSYTAFQDGLDHYCGDFESNDQRKVNMAKRTTGIEIVSISYLSESNMVTISSQFLFTAKQGRQEFVYAYQNSLSNNDNCPSSPASCMSYHSANDRGYFSVDFWDNFGGGVFVIGQSKEDVLRRDLKVVHGTLMYTLWGINIVVGAMVARFQKHTTWWLGVHRLLQLISSLTTLPVFYLTRYFVTGHFQTAHAVLGYLIIFVTTVQATLGSFMYSLPKHHYQLADIAEESDNLSMTVKGCITKHVDKAIGKPNIFGGYYKLCSEDKKQLKDFVKANVPKSRLYAPVLIWFLRHIELYKVSLSHRVLGRMLIIIAYVQVYLGLKLMDSHPLVTFMIFVWTFLVGIAIVYKEVEKRWYLPKGFTPKAKLAADKLKKSTRNLFQENAKRSDSCGSQIEKEEAIINSFYNKRPNPQLYAEDSRQAISNEDIVFDGETKDGQEGKDSAELVPC